MDSGNSGSLQSSSGGDEEYDSRATDGTVDSILINTHPPPQQLFEPFPNFTQHLHHQYPNKFNDPSAAWPGQTSVGSDPNPDNFNPFMSSFQPSPGPPPDGGHSNENDGNNDPRGGSTASPAARNSRKRSRASRRAPTTVLTTDKANFRAMVQEFTGVPAPPFGSASLPRSNRLDNLFGARSAFDVEAPTYVRRPFSQRGQTPAPFFVSSSTNSNITSSCSTTPVINYQQVPFSHAQTSNNLLLNINNKNQNQSPFFSSLLQSNPSKFIFSDSSDMVSKPHNQDSFGIPSNDIKNGTGLNEFSLGGHGNHANSTLNDLPGLISSDQTANNPENNMVRENAARWRLNISSHNEGAGPRENEGDGCNQAPLKPVNSGYDFSGSSSSNFHGEKSPENMAATGEQGMMESWIYSSE